MDEDDKVTLFRRPTASLNGLPTSTGSRHTGPLEKSRTADRVTASYAAERARLLFGQYRRGDANDPDVYVTAVTAVLAGYTTATVHYVTDPRTGISSREKFAAFMPNPGEVKLMCDEVERRDIARRIDEYEARSAAQLREREEREAASAKGPRRLPEHIVEELKAAGLWKKRSRTDHGETPGKVMDKLGLSRSEWDALPPTNASAAE
jgi:hypothetical protein